MTEAETGRTEAWRSAVWASALDLGCGILGALAFRRTAWRPLSTMPQFAGMGALALLALLWWRRAPRAVCLALFSLDVASALVTSLAGANAEAHAGQLGQLYHSLEAGLFVIAVLSPSARLGGALIGAFTVAPFVQFSGWPEAIRQSVFLPDLWLIPMYAVIALVLLLYRRRSVRLQRLLSDARADRLTLERLARVSLALRDLANTPLQTLTTGVDLLRRKLGAEQVVLQSMEHALLRLHDLKRALAPFEQHVEWRPREESFDAVAQIEQIAADLGRSPGR
jgi:hypothetical protein